MTFILQIPDKLFDLKNVVMFNSPSFPILNILNLDDKNQTLFSNLYKIIKF